MQVGKTDIRHVDERFGLKMTASRAAWVNVQINLYKRLITVTDHNSLIQGLT